MTHAPHPLPDAEQLRTIVQTMRAWLFALARTVLGLLACGGLDRTVRREVRRVLRGALWQVRAMIFLRALALMAPRRRNRPRRYAPNTPPGCRAARRRAPFRAFTRTLFPRTHSIRALFAQVVAGLRRMDRFARRLCARLARRSHGAGLVLVAPPAASPIFDAVAPVPRLDSS